MSFIKIRPIAAPDEIKSEIPVPDNLRKIKSERDSRIRDVLERKSDRFILVIGPCSAHDEKAVCEYVGRLGKLQEEVEEKLVLIARSYTNKPRTTGQGYKGIALQPDHLKGPNMAEGIHVIRRMHIKCLNESHLTAADEMLYPNNHPYLDDLLSYVAVGARSVENQQHRLTASGLDIPAGMKNPTSGDLKVALNSVFAAQNPHTFSYNGWEVRTEGNPYAHLILRGAVDFSGRPIPNYHYEDLIGIAEEYEKRNLSNPAILVDTNHDNSARNFQEQPRISMEVLQSRAYSSILGAFIRGLLIESFLVEGSQRPDEDVYGKSITDPCLGWEDSVALVRRIAEYC